MKGFNKSAAVVLAALAMTACNKEEVINNEDITVRFSAQIGEQTGEISAVTRASGETWTAGDRIGVYAFQNASTTVALDMENKEYKAKTTGTTTGFDAEDGVDIFYPVNGTQKFDFMAYYPHQDVTNFIYKVDVSNQDIPSDIDLLYAATVDDKSGGYDKEDGNVAFVFHHKLAKFTLGTVAGKGLTAADLVDMTVTIKGMNTKAEFDLKLAELADNASSPANLTPVTVENGVLYESIVLPAESLTTGEWTVEFEVNGDTYKWEVPAIELEEGKEYFWTIKVQKTPVLISAKIVDWNTVHGLGEAW